MKYKNEARDIAESMKKKNYMKLKEKYSLRLKEVEAIEKKEKLLLHQRVVNKPSHNMSYEAKLQNDRNNYHYSMNKGNKYSIISHSNPRSQDYKDSTRRGVMKPIHINKQNIKLPETTKGLDNLSIDDIDTRKARILRHAQEIREAASSNRLKASGVTSGMNLFNGSGPYSLSFNNKLITLF